MGPQGLPRWEGAVVGWGEHPAQALAPHKWTLLCSAPSRLPTSQRLIGAPRNQSWGCGLGGGGCPTRGSNYVTNKAQLKLRINQTAENKTFLSGTSNKRNENNKAGWVMKSQGCE